MVVKVGVGEVGQGDITSRPTTAISDFRELTAANTNLSNPSRGGGACDTCRFNWLSGRIVHQIREVVVEGGWGGAQLFTHFLQGSARASLFLLSHTRPDIQQFMALRRLFALTRDGDTQRRREEWGILPYLAAAAR